MFTQIPGKIRIVMLAGVAALLANRAEAQTVGDPSAPYTTNAAPAPDLYIRPYVPSQVQQAGAGGPIYYYYPAYGPYGYPGLGAWNPGPIYYPGSAYSINIQSGYFPRHGGIFARPRNGYRWW
jgi:hypothetical protein